MLYMIKNNADLLKLDASALLEAASQPKMLQGSVAISGTAKKAARGFVGIGGTGAHDIFESRVAAGRTEVDRILKNHGDSIIERTKNPTTQMVADLLIENGGALRRNEIMASFKARYGFPDSWVSPPKSINTGIARAVERGLIEEIQPGIFAAAEKGGNHANT
jgi:hypothetical protein